MRFLPINQENVSNAATLYVKIKNIPPHNMNWTYSAAYARLSAEIKNVGFEGYITFGESGYPVGFAMGHCEVREDGKNDFVLREMCFEANEGGKNAAAATLVHLNDELSARGVCKILVTCERTIELAEFFKALGFDLCNNFMYMQKNV